MPCGIYSTSSQSHYFEIISTQHMWHQQPTESNTRWWYRYHVTISASNYNHDWCMALVDCRGSSLCLRAYLAQHYNTGLKRDNCSCGLFGWLMRMNNTRVEYSDVMRNGWGCSERQRKVTPTWTADSLWTRPDYHTVNDCTSSSNNPLLINLATSLEHSTFICSSRVDVQPGMRDRF